MTILSDVKGTLGVLDTAFDDELLIRISGVISGLEQIGVTSFSDYEDIDEFTEWPTPEEEPLPSSAIAIYKALVPSKVRLSFDPPANGTIYSSMERNILELEARLSLHVEELEAEEPDPDTFWALLQSYISTNVAAIITMLGLDDVARLTSNIFTGDQNYGGNALVNYVVKEEIHNVSDTYEIDVSAAALYILVVQDAVSITFTNAPALGYAASVTVYLIQDGVGWHNVVFPGVKWDAGLVPDLAEATGTETDLTFVIRSGGSDIRGYVAAEGMS